MEMRYAPNPRAYSSFTTTNRRRAGENEKFYICIKQGLPCSSPVYCASSRAFNCQIIPEGAVSLHSSYICRLCSPSQEGHLATIQLGRVAMAVLSEQDPGRAVEPPITEQPASTKRSGQPRPARPVPTSPSGPRLLFVKNNTSQTPAETERGEKPRFSVGRHPQQLQGLCSLQLLREDTSCSLIAMAWRAHPRARPPQQGKCWSILRAPELKFL